MFMTRENITECVKSLKIKNTEGYDRILQHVLVDGLEWLIEPLAHLIKLIFNEKIVLEQWLISKIIPIHKKGNKANVENYRLVANLCSASKVFEQEIQDAIECKNIMKTLPLLTFKNQQ